MKNLTIILCLISSFQILAATKLPIMKIGNPILRATAQEVDHAKIADPKFQKFVDDLIYTMNANSGVGIAAPQVNESIRIFIMQSWPFVPLTVVINPKIEYIEADGKMRSVEGCLSIPGKQVKIQRYKKVFMSYYDRRGDFVSKELTGFGAIIAQHEYDHLNGILMIDLLEQMNTSMNFTGHSNAPLM